MTASPSGPPRRGPEPEEVCAIPDCRSTAERHLARGELERGFPQHRERLPAGRRLPLCRAHYREWKKATRKDRELERLAW